MDYHPKTGMSAQQTAQNLLAKAGITINGSKPYDIQVHNDKFYSRVLAGGSLALGESYMDGWWDVSQLDIFFDKLMTAGIETHLKTPRMALEFLKAKLTNRQSKSRAFQIGEKHYDLGNDLYRAMLDKSMTYTCGYWKDAKTLDAAQLAKLDLVCKKIQLKKGQRVLDIGCGWGSFAYHAAKKYGAKVVGLTVSKEQAELARERCKGLPVEIRLQDYRETAEEFDAIVSLGMFEHVGYKNYRTYMEVAHRCLKDGGFFLLHTIGGNKSVTTFDPWIEKYIFTNSMLPSIAQIGASIENLFVMEDWHNFGPYYDKTLMSWFANFDKKWPTLKGTYDARFYRMWKDYLLACAASFRARKNQVWQIVLSKNRVGAYQSVR